MKWDKIKIWLDNKMIREVKKIRVCERFMCEDKTSSAGCRGH